MSQIIEPPDESDIDRIAHQLIHASDLVENFTQKPLSGDISDLALIQATLDAKIVEPEATYSLQALGVAFGKVFVQENDFYDWWMVEDEYGRDPAIRYRETDLLVFPQTMISKRIEDGDAISINEMYDGLYKMLDEIRRENYPDA